MVGLEYFIPSNCEDIHFNKLVQNFAIYACIYTYMYTYVTHKYIHIYYI